MERGVRGKGAKEEATQSKMHYIDGLVGFAGRV
jgi:hypothetical protein